MKQILSFFKRFNPRIFLSTATEVGRRFPLPWLLSLAMAVLISYIIHHDGKASHNEELFWLGCVLFLGIPLLVAMELAAGRWQVVKSGCVNRLLFQSAGILLLVFFYYKEIPSPFAEPESADWLQWYIPTFFTFLLLVICLSYIGKPARANRFWVYCMELFLALIISGLFSAVLNGGLSAIMFASNTLFDLELSEKVYAYSALFSALPFFTFVLLSRFPEKLDEPGEPALLVKPLEILLLYVVWPLLLVYSIILLLYGGKILIDGEMPRGIVWGLVGWFTGMGLVASFFSWPHPIGHRFSRWFFQLTPLVLVLQWVAILERVDAYGLTIFRVYAVAASLFVTLAVLYFALYRKAEWVVAGTGLALLLVAVSYGPLSASSLAFKSQFHRLETVLKEQGALKSNNEWDWDVLRNAPDTVKEDIVEKTTYLMTQHFIQFSESPSVHPFDPVFFQKLSSWDRNNEAERILRNKLKIQPRAVQSDQRRFSMNEYASSAKILRPSRVHQFQWNSSNVFTHSSGQLESISVEFDQKMYRIPREGWQKAQEKILQSRDNSWESPVVVNAYDGENRAEIQITRAVFYKTKEWHLKSLEGYLVVPLSKP